MQTIFERFDLSQSVSLKFTPDAVALQDGETWAGLKVECWEGEGQEMEEAVLPDHCLIINLGEAIHGEMKWAGHRRVIAPLAPAQIAFVPANLPYSAVSTSYSKSLVLALRTDYVNAIGREYSTRHLELKPLYGIEDEVVVRAACAIARDVQEDHPMGEVYGESLQSTLVTRLLTQYSTHSITQPDINLGGKARIREYIIDNLHLNLHLADLANELKVDVSTFTRWFRKAFDISPHQFILRERVERAKVLLRVSKLDLAMIALDCGFSSQSHFSTCFKRCVGVPPLSYRVGFR